MKLLNDESFIIPENSIELSKLGSAKREDVVTKVTEIDDSIPEGRQIDPLWHELKDDPDRLMKSGEKARIISTHRVLDIVSGFSEVKLDIVEGRLESIHSINLVILVQAEKLARLLQSDIPHLRDTMEYDGEEMLVEEYLYSKGQKNLNPQGKVSLEELQEILGMVQGWYTITPEATI
jgi:hypothetical protein